MPAESLDNKQQQATTAESLTSSKRRPSNHDAPNGQDDNPNESRAKTPDERKKPKRALLIFGLVLLVAATGGVLYWLHARHFEETDDAQVDGNLSPIGTRVEGTIVRVYVDNNQRVNVGDRLVDLDPRDNEVSVKQAEAQVAQARAAFSTEQPNVPITFVQTSTSVSSAKATVASAEAALAGAERDRDQSSAQVIKQEAANTKAHKDLDRYSILVAKEEISRTDFDKYETNARQAAADLQAQQSALMAAERNIDQKRALLDQAKSQLEQSQQMVIPQLSSKRASVQQKQAAIRISEAQLEQAKLNLSYTRIVAPVAGVVMKREAQVGGRVAPGQQLLTISEIGNLWITANFKETQLLNMRAGQHATVHVDALDHDFSGYIETVGGATGSIASTLPPENATGNYVKVIQRIPVRIKLDPNQDAVDRLRPGMSAEPKVTVR